MKEDTAFNSVNIIIGFIVLSISIIVLILPNAVILSLIILLSIAIMASGVARIYNAFYSTYLNKIGKILKLITGILTFLVGLIVIIITYINPSISIIILISTIGYTFIVIGVARIFMGVVNEGYKKEYRIFLIIVGIITLIFAFMIVLFPILGYFILITYISLTYPFPFDLHLIIIIEYVIWHLFYLNN